MRKTTTSLCLAAVMGMGFSATATANTPSAPQLDRTQTVLATNYQNRGYYRGGYRAKTYQGRGYYGKRYYRGGGYRQAAVKRAGNYYGGYTFYPSYGYYQGPNPAYRYYRGYKPYTYRTNFRYVPRQFDYRRPYYYKSYYYPTYRAKHYKFGRPTSYRYGHYRYPARGHYGYWPVVNYYPAFIDQGKYYYYPIERPRGYRR